MLRLLHLPKSQLGLTLVFIFASALVFKPTISVATGFLFAVFFTLLFDVAFLKIRKVQGVIPISGLVTGLIIGLLTRPELPWYQFIVIAGLAMISKHFFSLGRKHIFNPAAFGLLFGSLLFAHDVSWWGVSFQQFKVNNVFLFVSFLILFLPGYISLYKIRRFNIIFSFLLSYSLLIFVLNKTVPLLDPTIVFFSLVMLPEPMTTPLKGLPQILFGIFVGLFTVLISGVNFLPDPLIAALLVGNLAFFKWRY